MNRSLIKKCLGETAILFIAVAIALLIFSWFRVWIVSELDVSKFTMIIKMLPEDWLDYTSVGFEWLVTYLGRTAMTLDEPFLVMLMAMFAIVRGTDVVSGEISRGTMEMILSQPVSRRQVFWTPVLFTLIGIVLLCGVVWFGMTLGVYTSQVKESTYPVFKDPISGIEIPNITADPIEETKTPMRERVNPVYFLPGITNLLFLSYFLVGIATLFSSMDRFRWRTLGIAIGFYMISAMVKIIAMPSDLFRWAQYLSFFTLYEPESFVLQAESNWSSQIYLLNYSESGELMGLGPLGYNLILFLLGSICLFAAMQIFKKRDIPAPV